MLKTTGYLDKLKHITLQSVTIFNQQNNKAYAAFKEQERNSRDPDDYDSDDAMYDENCGNQFVDPIILGVKSSFHILYILSQYTFFDVGLQYDSFHRLPKDLRCNQCPFCPEFKPTLQKYCIDTVIERQLSHQQEGKCKKRRSLYDCRSSTFNSTSFFSHFQGKKEKCPLHLLLWMYLNEMYPRKPSSRRK